MAHPEFRLPAFDAGARPKHAKHAWGVAVAVSATVALFGLGIALFLGTMGYDIRRQRMHETRLRRVLVQTPTVYQVTEGLKEKAPLARIVDSDRRLLDEAIRTWGGDKSEEIRRKADEWPQLRVFSAGDMMYFIYFDDTDIMTDYVCVTSEGSP